MSSSVATAVISNVHEAWKFLHGVVCIYKPLGWSFGRVRRELQNKVCEELNQMKQMPRKEIVEIRRVNRDEENKGIPFENEQIVDVIHDGNEQIEIVKGLSFSDHPLVSGPKFMRDDIKICGTCKTSGDVSGVHLFGINKGIKSAHRIFHSRWLRTYHVSGKFGIATDTFFHTGNIIEKATYGSIKRHHFERRLTSIQSSHQRYSFLAMGVPLESETAYELASQGLVRPSETSNPVIYSIKCIEFEPPDFTIEVKAINDDAQYLKQLIHDIGLELRSVATCTKLRCINMGPFGLKDALLFRHWTIQNIVNSMKSSRVKFKEFNNLKGRDPLVTCDLTGDEVYSEQAKDGQTA